MVGEFPELFEDKLAAVPEEQREEVSRVLSNARADQLLENPIEGSYDLAHLSAIHKHVFQDVSTLAGIVRDYGMSKGANFADPQQIQYLVINELPGRINAVRASHEDVEQYKNAVTDLHSTLDLAHPYRDGNGRSSRIFMSQLANEHGYDLKFESVEKDKWIEACIASVVDADDTMKRELMDQIVKTKQEI